MEDLVHLLEVEASLLLKQVDVVLIGEGLWLLTHLNSVSFFNPMLVKSVFFFSLSATNSHSRYVSVVYDKVLDLTGLSRHTRLCPCISGYPETI